MVDFSDREEVKRWLDEIVPAQRRREVAVALAARAALRVLPLLGRELTHRARQRDEILSAVALPCLRATALSWAAGKYPTHGPEVSAVADAAAVAARAAADAARAVRVAAFADATFADAALIYFGHSGAKLAGMPLWPNGAPDWVTKAWRTLKSALLAANEGWEVWTDWYEARLAGDAAHPPNEALEVARATIPDKIWRQGPAAANTEIKRLIELHDTNSGTTKETPQPIPVVVSFTMPLEIGAAVTASAASLAPGNSFPPIPAPKPAAIGSIPDQERTGTRFGVDAEGRIDVVRVPPATDELQRLHYDEMRHKALALAALG